MVYNAQNYWVFAQYSRNYKTLRFGNWICLLPRVRVQTRTQLD
jgi:hypothetical protein